MTDTAAVPAEAARYQVLETPIDAFTVPTFLEHVAAHVGTGETHLVANHNVNSLALLQRSAPFRAFYERPHAVFIDGMPVVWLARLEGHPVRAEHRIGVLDWIWPFAERAEREGWNVVHLGGSDDVNDGAARLLTARHPGLKLATVNGYFDATPGSAESAAVVARLRELRPDVLLVGMGMPRQEAWVLANLDDLPPSVVITVGGIFGYLAGDRPTAPRWMGTLGVEWLFRLVTEPRRLWRRYLVEPLVLVGPILRAVRRRV